MELIEAIKMCDRNKISNLLRRIDPNQKVNGVYPLLASLNCSDESAMILLNYIKIDLMIEDQYKHGILYYIAMGNRLAILKYLITTKKVNIRTLPDNGEPMKIAINNGFVDLANYLALNGAKYGVDDIFNAIDVNDDLNYRLFESLLLRSYSENKLKSPVVHKLLIELVKDNLSEHLYILIRFYPHEMMEVINRLDLTKNGAIHYAARNGNLTIIKILLQNGVNINLRNADGDTPLHVAANMDTYHFLVNNGAYQTIKNNEGLLPSQLIKHSPHLDDIVFDDEVGTDYDD